MADLWQFQTNMNRGELDPQLAGRTDLQAYYNGLKEATNVLTIPQGGVKKRPGMEYLGDSEGDGRLETFSFNTEQNYLLVFSSLKMQVFKDGVLQTNINGSGNDYLVIPWTAAQIEEMDYIQSADTIIITHEDVEPRTITRTSDTAWAIATIPLVNIPQLDYNDGSSPTPVSNIQRITFAHQSNGDRYKISLNSVLTDDIIYGSDDGANIANITDALQALPNTANSGVSVSTITSLSVYEITFSGDSADDYEKLTITPVFTRSVDFVTSTTVTQAGTSGAEDVWSAGRGWPRTCTFHEARLWFGGSKSKPSTLWGSMVSDFFNFSKGRSRDDEGITATLDTDQLNAINSLFSNRSLQIFTTGGEFYIKESPVTPENVAVLPQSNLGAKRARAVTVDGVTLFIQKTGKALNQFVFINDFQANESRSVSVLSPHLIKNPKKLTLSVGTESSDANYVYMVNDDGTVTVFNTLSNEDISAFTAWISSAATGFIKSVTVVDFKVYMLIERVIDGSTVYFIERENALLNTDSAVIGTGLVSATLTGLDHLEGETVKVKADGAVMADAVVSGGSITTERTADTIEAGLEYKPVVTTMPLNTNLKNGPNAASKKRITRAAIHVYESNGIIVNDNRLADKTIGQNQFDAPEPQTEFKRLFLHGWSLEASVTITQDTPMPFQILSIGTETKT